MGFKMMKKIFLTICLLSVLYVGNVFAQSCGDTLTIDTTLLGDIGPCETSIGFTLSGASVDLDGDDYSFTGTWSGTACTFGVSMTDDTQTVSNLSLYYFPVVFNHPRIIDDCHIEWSHAGLSNGYGATKR